MSGWFDDGGSRRPSNPSTKIELSFDLEQASEWMGELDDLGDETRNDMFKKILNVIVKEEGKEPTKEEEERVANVSGALKKDLRDLEDAKKRATRSDVAIRPSEVRSTERDRRDDRIYFYNSDERTTKSCIGWRPFDEWFRISEHMQKSMAPDCTDMTENVIFWTPRIED